MNLFIFTFSVDLSKIATPGIVFLKNTSILLFSANIIYGITDSSTNIL